MNPKWIPLFIFPLLLCFGKQASSQNTFFKITVAQEGIYKISESQAKQLGAASLNEVALYGIPGMLPQKLDSSHLELQEIPGLESNGSLLFYLPSPHNYYTTESGTINYEHNLFTDSISFLIGIKINGLRISTGKATAGPTQSSDLYQWYWLKENENNILNSGRSWYSRALAPGVTRGYPLALQSKNTAPWKLVGTVMAQSLQESVVTLAFDDLKIADVTLAAITNDIYGIKGREAEVSINFHPPANGVARFRMSFQSSDVNSSAYFEHIGIGVPSSGSNIAPGIYTSAEPEVTLQPESNLSAWQIDDVYEPISLDFSTGSKVTGRKFVVFDENSVPDIPNPQETRLILRESSSWPDLLIIAPRSLSAAAMKLSQHKLGMGVHAEVAYVADIYDSFGYGNPDVSAIRNFIAWHYHGGNKLKNVLLLGKGTFNYRKVDGGRPNLVPTYTSRNSLDPLRSFSSDDYYGLLDYGQGSWEESRAGDEQMKIGVGRLPIINTKEASIVVDKIIHYETSAKKGDWKQKVSFLADDGDNNIHLKESEAHATYLNRNHQEIKIEKLYLDRFEQETSNGLQTSTQAKSALEKTLAEGTLLLNYVGHGNGTTLAAEEIFKVGDIQNWADQDQLALWITATCEFGRHDSPFIRSAAEELLIAENKGAIALLTTGRPVFSSVNFALNEAFFQEVFRTENEMQLDLGSIFRHTKNKSLNGALNRNFSLLGDPSMRLSAPYYEVKLKTLTSANSNSDLDTLAPLQKVEYEAEVVNPSTGVIVPNFNGKYSLELLDKPSVTQTLGDESNAIVYMEEQVLLFKGEGKVESGKIKGSFMLPKNSDPEVRNGKIRLYAVAENNDWEASGTNVKTIGGEIVDSLVDNEGPKIVVKLGGKTEGPFLFPSSSLRIEAHFLDESGINISANIPDKNLSIQINDNSPVIVNELFVSENSSYVSGNLTFTTKELIEGKNSIIIKVWDNLGNGSVYQQEIEVIGSNRAQILSHKVYPNPASTEANFELHHNQTGKNLILTLTVYETSGRILFTRRDRLVKADAHIGDLTWFFLQSQTKYPAKGTYIYKLTLQPEDENSVAFASGKIVIK